MGNVPVVELLVEHKASMDAKSNDGNEIFRFHCQYLSFLASVVHSCNQKPFKMSTNFAIVLGAIVFSHVLGLSFLVMFLFCMF